ncbi:3'-5' exonuclease KapD [Bacillus kexueae]|uniref:3'-5' exonuclease KapD n=1 Tax=Aeribacillus kexueae TaxID=2078952 RepID=UPI001FAFCB1C|nr:3'-5' exonuclease KapD [Bacillus kexueae]
MESSHQYLFIDFEFTMPEGKSLPKGFFPEIIEAGYVVVSANKIIKKYSSYIKPTFFPSLTNRCKKFLQISQEQVDLGITFPDFIQLLQQDVFENRTTVVTWGNMDMKVLRQNCHKHRLPFPFQHKELDLSMEYKKFFGDRNQTGLWKAVEAYGKKGTGKHHRALDDALTTYKIFQLVEKDKQYLAKPKPTTIGERVDLSKLLGKLAT